MSRPKTTTRSTRSTRAQTDNPSVAVDATLKRQWDKLDRIVAETRGEGMSSFDRLWETVGAIVEHDPPLYVLGGFRSADDYFREHLKEDPRAAWRYIRVAKFASPREEERYGTSKIDAVLAFIEANAGAPIKRRTPVDFERLRIPVLRDGAEKRLGLDDVSVAEVQAATRAVRRGDKPAKRSAVESGLARALGDIESLATVQVVERGGLLSFLRVPVAALGRFARTVAAAANASPRPEPLRPLPAKPKPAVKRKQATKRKASR